MQVRPILLLCVSLSNHPELHAGCCRCQTACTQMGPIMQPQWRQGDNRIQIRITLSNTMMPFMQQHTMVVFCRPNQTWLYMHLRQHSCVVFLEVAALSDSYHNLSDPVVPSALLVTWHSCYCLGVLLLGARTAYLAQAFSILKYAPEGVFDTASTAHGQHCIMFVLTSLCSSCQTT